jgi:hypothetical protein
MCLTKKDKLKFKDIKINLLTTNFFKKALNVKLNKLKLPHTNKHKLISNVKKNNHGLKWKKKSLTSMATKAIHSVSNHQTI